jgi:hypothetical protein
MPDVTVHPHGDRWAVALPDASSPVREFGTREAAESAARELAGDGEIEVLEQDPSSLGGGAQAPAEGDEDDAPRPPVDGMRDRERLRTEQGGL